MHLALAIGIASMTLPDHIQQLAIRPLDVTLWRVDLTVSLTPTDLSLLSSTEQERAARFRFERDARRYGVSHVALRQVLAQALGQILGEIAPADIDYEVNAYGKPRLSTGDMQFNMSHSGDWALIGISRTHALGVDVEVSQPMPDAPDLARRHFTMAEHAAYMAGPMDQREAHFLRCWTRKEACLKALGSGLSLEPRLFEVSIGDDLKTTTVASPDGQHLVDVVSVPWPEGSNTAHAAVARIRGSARTHQ